MLVSGSVYDIWTFVDFMFITKYEYINYADVFFDNTSYQIANSMVRESIEKIWEEHSDFHSSRVEILSTILGWIKDLYRWTTAF